MFRSLIQKAALALALTVSLVGAEPANLHGDLTIPNMRLVKDAMREYKNSGRYVKEMDAIAGQARVYLETNLTRHKKPAIVLDIDETVLSNYPCIDACDFGFLPNEWNEWVLKGEAPAFQGALDLFRYARSHDVAVFFITGRPENQRQATVTNLQKEGFEGWKELVMKADADHSLTSEFKTQQRRKVFDQGYTIVVNMGDQMSDLEGGYAEATFKLPNPMYFVP